MPPVTGGPVKIRFDNIDNRETVYQRLLIIQGFVEGSPNARDTLLVQPDAKFEPALWQINHGHFKALVPLKPGANELLFNVFAGDFPELSSLISSHAPVAEQRLSTWYQRDRGSLPVQLAILVARDSPALRAPSRAPSKQPQVQESTRHSKLGSLTSKFQNVLQVGSAHDDTDRALVDAPPGEQRERLRKLEEVQRRFALQAYLWQAFHAEQMRRMGLGRRTFALDDGHSDQKEVAGDISLYPKVHVLISNRTVSEIRHPDNAQQNKRAKNDGAQHEFAGDVLRDPSRCPPELMQNVTAPIAILTLDTMWDPQMKLLRGHAALGSADPGGRSYGVMGSHWLWAAPSSLQEVTSAFNETRPTDTSCCVDDLGECKYAFETLNVGSGAMFHELGHALNNPHWPSGLMSRGYVEFNRAFMTAEGPRCKRPGNLNPITPQNDSGTNHLHRAQGVRARFHPSFVIPTDPPLPFLDQNDPGAFSAWLQNEPHWEPTRNGALVSCASGIGCLEIEVDGNYRTHIEFLGLAGGEQPRKSMSITAEYIASIVQFDPRHPSSPTVSLNVLGCNMRQVHLKDFRGQAFAHEISVAGVPFPVTKGMCVGMPDPAQQHWLHVFKQSRQNVTLSSIVIRAGACLDGLELIYSDGSRQVLGGTGGSARQFNIAPNEQIVRVEVRSGAWLDAIEIVLSSGRTSGWHGGNGGGRRTLAPAQGQTIVGFYGSHQQWLHSLGLVLA